MSFSVRQICLKQVPTKGSSKLLSKEHDEGLSGTPLGNMGVLKVAIQQHEGKL